MQKNVKTSTKHTEKPAEKLQTIAVARNGFSDKFGIPRQPREGSLLVTRIEFMPDFRSRDALRGIEQYSHLWLIWGFNAAAGAEDGTWKATVRPPRLGGNRRVGVFATRSPFRPNRLGLSSVRLLGVEDEGDKGPVLVVAGADMMDGSPIYDIKPYIAYTDSHPEALGGFADEHANDRLTVHWEADTTQMPQETKAALEEILQQDPRPAYQHNAARVYKLDYAGCKAEFRVSDGVLTVTKVEAGE